MEKNWMIADLHIHSKYSRACSKDLTFNNLAKWAKIKGLNLLGTGDFTHPLWIQEIKRLTPNNKGFYYYGDFPFIISGEVSLVYTQESRGRRIHLLLLAPDIETAERINSYLDTKGRRDYDGRPIFNISAEEFSRQINLISKSIEIIPAHAWTPWFGVFGSMSGFDSLKEGFGSEFENIHAIETGISSNPAMNWRIKELEKKSILSFSDAHSFWPFRLGREATIFEKTDSYLEIIAQIRKNSFIATIETDPAYGKYHWDGHRACNFSCSPEQSKKFGEICPICKKHLTIGVENRVEQLSEKDFLSEYKKKFYTLLPLQEILAFGFNTSVSSKKVWETYNLLISSFGNEFEVLLNSPKEEFLSKKIDEKIINLILKNREGRISIKPGFDGEYGVVILEEKQKTLF